MRIRVIYSGKVQGIGFRYTAQSIAHQLGVTGWVKNCRDGTVEIVAEAAEETLKRFLGQIDETFSKHIRDSEVSWSEQTGEFSGFEVEF